MRTIRAWVRFRFEELALFVLDRLNPELAAREGRDRQRLPFGTR